MDITVSNYTEDILDLYAFATGKSLAGLSFSDYLDARRQAMAEIRDGFDISDKDRMGTEIKKPVAAVDTAQSMAKQIAKREPELISQETLQDMLSEGSETPVLGDMDILKSIADGWND